MLTIVDTTDDITAFFRWLGEQDTIAFDTETTGLEVHSPGFRVRLAQFGSRDEAWLIDTRRWLGVVEDALRMFRGTILIHNAAYDAHAMRTCGVEIPWDRVVDTMLASQLARPGRSAGLKRLAEQFTSHGAAAAQTELNDVFSKNNWFWDTIPIDHPVYLRYAALDVILLSRIWEAPEVRAGAESPLFATEMALRKIANSIERNGMRVDIEFSRKQAEGLRQEAELAGLKIDELTGNAIDNPRSNAQLGHWIHEVMGVRAKRWTQNNAPKVDKDALEMIRVENPGIVADVIDQALRIRSLDKLAGTYFENFIDMADHNDLLHPEIRTLGARTGRQSVAVPALQTLPSRDPSPEARAVRQAILPRYDDEVILACDADQIELRLAASIANDAGLIEAFRIADEPGGLDFFTQSVRSVHRDPEATKADYRRSTIKNFWYSNLYGAGVEKMAATAGVPISEMEGVKQGIAEAYPQYARLGNRVQNLAREEGFTVTTAYGRRLAVDEEKLYAATNYMIQGTAADILKRATIDIAQAGLEDALLITVHDEIVVSVPPEDVDEVSHILEASMTNHDFRVPLTAGCSPPVSRWGDAK